MLKRLLFQKVPVLLCVALALAACLGEVDIPYPTYPEQIVLNGILNPDSALSISLYKTLPPLSADTVYPPVGNARVRCYENGRLLGELHATEPGQYALDGIRPKPGLAYRIEAEVDGLTVSATDTVPEFLPFTMEIKPYAIKNPNGNPDIHLTWEQPLNGEQFIWFTNTGIAYTRIWFTDTTRYFRERGAGILSASPYLDEFNASPLEPGAILNSYYLLARVIPAQVGQGTVISAYGNQPYNYQHPGAGLYLYVMNVSRAYDRYMKTVILAIKNRFVGDNDRLNNPFYEPINVYSNVENGLGILGSVNARKRVLVEGK
jgi:hypothetical protein